MTKQGKIDWKLRSLLGELFGVDEDEYLYRASKEVREYLHSQGVRRMKDELPIITKKGWYHLVEPLIEEEQDVLQH